MNTFPLRKYGYFIFAAAVGTLLSTSAPAQDAKPAQVRPPAAVNTANNTVRGGTNGTFGGFVGFTDRNDADLTVGLQYEHDLAGPWSAGAVLEHTPDYLFEDDATVLMGTAHYRPLFNSRLKFTGGAGVEFKDIGGDEVIFRTGIAYDVFVEGPLTLTPGLALNFADGQESVTLGAGLHYRF